MKLESLKKFDDCLYTKISSESKASESFEGCVSSQALKDTEIGKLLQNCYEGKRNETSMTTKDFNSCMFCKKMDSEEVRDHCNMRYMKDYGHDLNEFQANVGKFFVK